MSTKGVATARVCEAYSKCMNDLLAKVVMRAVESRESMAKWNASFYASVERNCEWDEPIRPMEVESTQALVAVAPRLGTDFCAALCE